MSEKTVEAADLAKALSALQNIAKGHSGKGTPATEVESMADGSVGAGSGSGATQVYHTESNSDRGSWAGSTWNGVADNGPGVDSISENGTDYSKQGKVMKSIMDKLAKGQQLTASEYTILKGFMAKDDKEDVDKAGFPFDKDKDKDDKKMDKAKDDEDEMGKSLSQFARENDDVSKGLEVSEFLAGFADVVNKSLQAMESRIVNRLLKAQSVESSENGEFQKSLAEAVVGLGQAITSVAQRQTQLESAPARAPRAEASAAGIVEKGGFAGPGGSEEVLNKALVAATLVNLVGKGEASVQDVIKYESNGYLSPQLEAQVRAAVSR